MTVKTALEWSAWLIVPGVIYFVVASNLPGRATASAAPKLSAPRLAAQIKQSLQKYRGLYADVSDIPFVKRGANNVVVFVDPTCEVCETAIAHLESRLGTWSKPPRITLVVLKDSPAARKKQWTSNAQIAVHFATAPEQVQVRHTFGTVDSFPLCIVTDAQQKVVYVSTGIQSDTPTTDNVSKTVDALVQDAPAPPWKGHTPIDPSGTSPSLQALKSLSHRSLVAGVYADTMDETLLAKWRVLELLHRSGNVELACVVPSADVSLDALGSPGNRPRRIVDTGNRFKTELGIGSAPILFLMRDGIVFAREAEANTDSRAILGVAQQAVLFVRRKPSTE